MLDVLFFPIELEQKMLQFVWKHKRPWMTKAILRKKNRTEGIRLPDFKLYYNIQNNVVLAHKKRNIDQWNRIESLGTNPHNY